MLHRARRATITVIALVFVLAACGHTDNGTGGTAPPGVGLYQPPAVIPGTPGTVIWHRPIAINGVPAKAWKILYHSVGATGQKIGVSGVIAVPTAPYSAGPRPVVSLAPETAGITDDCAPSKAISSNDWHEGGYLQRVLEKGFAVAITDYEGLGTPGRHTYMVKDSQAHTVLDIVRAAIRFPEMGLNADTPVGIWGYSQGGGAATAAAEAAGTYVPELKVKGTSAGGVPADLIDVNDNLEGGFYGFGLAAAQGFDAVYPELRLSTWANAAGKDLLNQVDRNSRNVCLGHLIMEWLGKRSTDYVDPKMLQSPEWKNRLNGAKLGLTKPSAPIFVYHGIFDEIIPRSVAAALADRYCQIGADVKWDGNFVPEHLLAQAGGAGDAVAYLADRFAGKPAPKTC